MILPTDLQHLLPQSPQQHPPLALSTACSHLLIIRLQMAELQGGVVRVVNNGDFVVV